MKKVIFGLAAVAGLVIAGCSKDEDVDSRVKSIRGKWYPVSITTIVDDNVNFKWDTTVTPVYPGDYIDFRSDGNLYSYTTDPNGGANYDPHDTVTFKFGNPYLVLGKDTVNAVQTKDSLFLYHQVITPTHFAETTFKYKR